MLGEINLAHPAGPDFIEDEVVPQNQRFPVARIGHPRLILRQFLRSHEFLRQSLPVRREGFEFPDKLSSNSCRANNSAWTSRRTN